jgi:hypothetical protein
VLRSVFSKIRAEDVAVTVSLPFCLQAVTKLQDTLINMKQKDGTWKHILAKHLIPDSDLVSFLTEPNCLGAGTCATMMGRHFSVSLCRSAGTTILRGGELGVWPQPV